MYFQNNDSRSMSVDEYRWQWPHRHRYTIATARSTSSVLRTVLKLSARTVFALLSLDKEWSQSVRVSICCSPVSHWRTAAADHTWQHKPVRQAPVTGAKCVFFPRHVLQTISLKVRFIARLFFPSSLSISLSLPPKPSAFYFLFPHLSHRNLYNFYRILLSASARYRLLCFAHAAQRCTVVQFLSLPPAIISPTTHLFIPCYT